MTTLEQPEYLFELVNDSVMTRTMEGRINFWNRSAEELYGWRKEEAVGRVSHNLLQTQFPKPLKEIESELLENGIWEGKLVHTTRDGGSVVVDSRWTLDLKGQFGAVLEINTRSTDPEARTGSHSVEIGKEPLPSKLAETRTVPICVDLDGTLVKTDTLLEMFLAVLGKLRTLLLIPYWLFAGKARLKHELACRVKFNPALLPYNEELVAYLRQQKREGRRLILCTAADQRVANAVSAHLRLFEEVLASQNDCNLKGAEKARVLIERFGSGHFTYAGNAFADLAVWRQAKSGILVNTSSRVAKALSGLIPIELQLGPQTRLSPLLNALRPHQWSKNLLVFVPIITANATGYLADWLSAVLLFMAFCAVASSIYLFNDLTDLAADRQHPRKKHRPFASGALSIATGLVCIPILFLAGVVLALMSGALWAVALYAMISVAYSIWLKELAIVDLFALASLYSLRLLAGGEATQHSVSLWLLGFSSFMFFSLAIVKRISELMQHKSETRVVARRGYRKNDLHLLQLMGVSSSFVSAMILALYVQSPEIVVRYTYPKLLWLIVPLMLFWQCHIWLATTRGSMHDDPIIYAANDWVSRGVVICLVLVFFLASAAL